MLKCSENRCTSDACAALHSARSEVGRVLWKCSLVPVCCVRSRTGPGVGCRAYGVSAEVQVVTSSHSGHSFMGMLKVAIMDTKMQCKVQTRKSVQVHVWCCGWCNHGGVYLGR